jgi:hypothetical protein
MDRPAHKENKVKSTQIIRKTNPESIATYLLSNSSPQSRRGRKENEYFSFC